MADFVGVIVRVTVSTNVCVEVSFSDLLDVTTSVKDSVRLVITV